MAMEDYPACLMVESGQNSRGEKLYDLYELTLVAATGRPVTNKLGEIPFVHKGRFNRAECERLGNGKAESLRKPIGTHDPLEPPH
jgi:Holliday junction resolvasome RuvABC ATP-dependent DNA helicase subunit